MQKKAKTILFYVWCVFYFLLCILLLVWQGLKLLPAPKLLEVSDVYYVLSEDKPNLLEGVSAVDSFGRDITQDILIDQSLVVWDELGEYAIKYTVVDKLGKKTYLYANLIIANSLPYFVDIEEFYCLQTEQFELDDIKAFDGFGNEIENIYVPNIDTDQLGAFQIKISCQDRFGLIIEKDITIYVIESFSPQFILKNEPIKYTIGLGWKNIFEDIKAVDYKGQDISKNIIVDTKDLDYNQLGEYIVTMLVTDDDGNFVERDLIVLVQDIGDELYPKIIGVKDFEIELGEGEPDWMEGITATDFTDGDLTRKIEVDSSGVDIDRLGDYEVFYSVENSLGLEYRTFANAFVIQTPIDNTSPEIRGATEDVVYYIPDIGEEGSCLFDLCMEGVQAIDDRDGDITDKIELIILDEDNVNIEVPGEFKVKYSVSDQAGNEATLIRTVKVLDNCPPRFFNVKTEWVINVGSPLPEYLEYVTARDNVDGDLTEDIVTEGEAGVKSSEVGEYTIIIKVKDTVGNESSVEIIIIIVDNVDENNLL